MKHRVIQEDWDHPRCEERIHRMERSGGDEKNCGKYPAGHEKCLRDQIRGY